MRERDSVCDIIDAEHDLSHTGRARVPDEARRHRIDVPRNLKEA